MKFPVPRLIEDIWIWFRDVTFFLNRWFGTSGTELRLGYNPDNYTAIEEDGTLVSVGSATTWNDINISLVPPQGAAATPAVISVNGDARLDCYAFSGTNVIPDEIHGSLEIMHDYKEGSDIVFHVHWAPTTTNVGNVKWQLRYAWFGTNEVPTATTASVVATTSGVAWQQATSNITIVGTNKLMGSRFMFCLFRDATDVQDTYAFDAATFDMGVHYERDTLGSRQITSK